MGLKRRNNALPETMIHGIKKLRTAVEKEIARNVTRMDRLQRQKTPEGVEVVTPGAEVISSDSVAIREVEIRNLPWFQLLEDMQRVIFQVMDDRIAGYSGVPSALEQPNDPLAILDVSLFTGNLFQMALGRDRVKLPSSDTTLSSRQSEKMDFTLVLNSGSWAETQIPLSSYLPPNVASSAMSSLSTIHSLGIPPQFIALLSFMQSFIYLTNNAILQKDALFDGVRWLLDNIDRRLLSYLFSLQTTSIRIFMVKILPAVIKYGNIKLAQEVIDWTINNAVRLSRSCMRNCMRMAVMNGDTKMVELLCRATFPPCVAIDSFLEADKTWLPWNKGNVEVLKRLLSFQADPDYLCEGKRGLALTGASRSGNLEAVDILLKVGCQVNLLLEDFYGSALQVVVFGDHSNIVEILIQHGADPNIACARPPSYSFYTHKSCQTPLQIACENGNASIVDMLLAHGVSAELDTVPNNGGNALHFCVRAGNIDFVRKLLRHGCNPNSRVFPRQIDAPLQTAAQNDYPDIIQELIKYGADVNISPRRCNGRTALQAAAEIGSLQIIEMLVAKGANINAPACHDRGLTALQAAIKNGHFPIAQRLLMLGAEINAPPCHIKGVTAIQAAAFAGDMNMIQYLLDRGADLNGPESDESGISVLAAAMKHKDPSMLKFLVKHGARICGLEEHARKPPIVAAAENGWIHGARYLLENGANVDSYYTKYDNLGSRSPIFCALRCAIDMGHVQMIELLLANGAELRLLYTKGFKVDALCYALERAQCYSKEAVQLLLQWYTRSGDTTFDEHTLASAVSATIKTEDTTVLTLIVNVISRFPRYQNATQINKARQRHLEYIDKRECYRDELVVEVTKLLIRVGADVNLRVQMINKAFPNNETTLLQRVVASGRVLLTKWALNEGAEIQAPASEFTGTPLQEAIQKANVELVNILLGRNPDVNSPPAKIWGRTALQAAATRGQMEIAIELIRRGAHVAAPAAELGGITAINGAASKGREDMLQLLLNHYDGFERLDAVCEEAATYAGRGGHCVIGEWLREYCKVQNKN